MKVLSLICVFLALWTVISFRMINSLEESKKAIEQEKNALKIEIERYYENELEKSERKAVAVELAKKDKENFDWNRDISHSAVLNELRKTCKACRASN